jgi:membrane protease YdiL (CAAX protease family)
MKKKQAWIIIMVVLACFCMGYVDAALRPGYVLKSVIKLALFLGLPLIYSGIDRDFRARSLFRADKRGLLTAIALGAGVYLLILGAYFALRSFFDFSALTTALTAQTGVAKDNFLWVSLYISFVNSLLEEFFFRGFAFLTLKRVVMQGAGRSVSKLPEDKAPAAAVSGIRSVRGIAYAFSAFAFAAYHIAMMLGWFAPAVTVLALIGLFAGGLIFDRFDEPGSSIWLSWLVHMFANFAINTVGFILFAA